MSGNRRDEAALRAALIEAGRAFHRRGLAIGTAGNLSVRLDDGFLVTPTNSSLGHLDPARLTKLGVDWHYLSGDKPTKEIAMHRAFYDTRSTVEAVVHLHSPHAAALSFMRNLPMHDPIPPFSPYFIMRVGHLPVLSYFCPGSDAIGEAIRGLGGIYRAVLLANHGPAVAGASLDEAINTAEELEEAARIFIMIGPERLAILDAAAIDELKKKYNLDW